MKTKFPLRCCRTLNLFYLLLNIVRDKPGFLQINLDLRIPTRTTLLVIDSLRVLKEYSWLCPWIFLWPDYEEDYQDDGQQDGYDN